MAVANGYGKVVTSGSVFMYDTGDTYNSYKGQPGTNITTGVGRNYNGYSRTDYEAGVFFESNGYTEVVNIPALGPTTVQSVEINNSAPGYQCCPNLYNYTGGWMSPIWLPGQTYSYQIIYKCRSGYTNPNFMYHYEYTAGESYLTEYGVFTTDKQESLGDGWYHAWNTFTTNASAAKGYTGLWYYQYYVADKISIAAVSITPGNTIRPPQQIIPSGTTRSATQGLLPIVGNSSIDLSNVSFTSNAQMTFDGSDDYINTNFTSGPNGTVELILKSNSYEGKIPFSINSDTYSSGPNIYFACGAINWNIGDSCDSAFPNSSYPNSNYHHLVITNNSAGSALLYIDGNFIGTTSGKNMTTTGNNKLWLGRYHDGSYNFSGELPIVKTYNRVLSAAEIVQNYNKYKTRFNLP